MRSNLAPLIQSALKLEGMNSYVDRLDGTPITYFPAHDVPKAGVCVCIGLDNDLPHLLLIKRTENPKDPHSGQMAFAGGRVDPIDQSHPDPTLSAAMREAQEETGILPNQLLHLGELPGLSPIRTRTWIHPHVFLHERPLTEIHLQLDPTEVAKALWIPFSFFMDPQALNFKERHFGEFRFNNPTYIFDGHEIWGATGAMIHNLFERIKKLGGLP